MPSRKEGVGLHLQATQLSAGYNDRQILNSIDLQLPPGQWLGIIGPNGAGKTTLLRTLSHYLPASAGSVHLNGRDISNMTAKQLAQSVALAGVELPAVEDLTVAELVLLGRTPHLSQWQKESAADWAIVEEALDLTDLTQLAQRPLTRLSAGEKQKALLAAAIAQQPRLLLLDEPTAHLDIHHQVQVLDLLDKLRHRQNLTLVSVLHDLNLAALYCDRLLLLQAGSVYASGSPAKVLTARKIEKVYGCPVHIYQHPLSGAPQITLLPGGRRPGGMEAADGEAVKTRPPA